jgi:large subunit ribosomal protein L3
MNTNPGLIGKKLGNTQIFQNDGTVTRVTAVKVGPCVVLGKRTPDRHGYSALQLGFGERREKSVRKPEKGYFDKIGVTPPQVVREFRVPQELLDKVEIGQRLRASDLFREGMMVDVVGTSKGRGYTGVVKRHNFGGAGTITHGTHEYKRHGGSIGQNMSPGRVHPNRGMPGQYGSERVTIHNQQVVQVVEEDDMVLIEGAIPGPKQGIVTVRGAVKRPPVTPPFAEASQGEAAEA